MPEPKESDLLAQEVHREGGEVMMPGNIDYWKQINRGETVIDFKAEAEEFWDKLGQGTNQDDYDLIEQFGRRCVKEAWKKAQEIVEEQRFGLVDEEGHWTDIRNGWEGALNAVTARFRAKAAEIEEGK